MLTLRVVGCCGGVDIRSGEVLTLRVVGCCKDIRGQTLSKD